MKRAGMIIAGVAIDGGSRDTVRIDPTEGR